LISFTAVLITISYNEKLHQITDRFKKRQDQKAYSTPQTGVSIFKENYYL